MDLLNVETPDGVHTVAIRDVFLETEDATVYSVEFEGTRFAALVFRDNQIITSADWHGTCGHDDAETVLSELKDPAWAHHWMDPRTLQSCVIVDGLPRLLHAK
jgi:hypothetical protein